MQAYPIRTLLIMTTLWRSTCSNVGAPESIEPVLGFANDELIYPEPANSL